MTASVTADIAAGMAARHEGQSATIAADESVIRMHGRFIREALRYWIAAGVAFDADNVRETAEQLAEQCGHHFDPSPNLLPSLMGGAASAGRIRHTGAWVNSSRRPRNASKNRVYIAATTSATTPTGNPPR